MGDVGRALDIDHLRPEVPPSERGDEVRRLRDGGAVVAVAATSIDELRAEQGAYRIFSVDEGYLPYSTAEHEAIFAALERHELVHLMERAAVHGLDELVEVHTAAELAPALELLAAVARQRSLVAVVSEPPQVTSGTHKIDRKSTRLNSSHT